jgi:bifunctional DNA primase/polymerase-like protein/primase-like protein
MSGVFAEWQPRYAEHHVATFPVDGKRPCIRAYDKVGLRASAQLAIKFNEAEALGFMCGPRSGITVIDIDSHDERMVGEAQRMFGESPIIWRTGSGNYAMPFRHNGEGRRIRAVPGLPIDILGAGFAVAPPSIGAKGQYAFVQGGLADLDWLPCLAPKYQAGLVFDEKGTPRHEIIPIGKRDNALFRIALAQAPFTDDFNGLLDVIRTRNMDCEMPLPDAQIIKLTHSAWRYEQEGRNLAGRGRAMVMANATFDALIAESADAWLLYSHLRRHHWGRDFVLANAMAASLGWRGGGGLVRFRAARDALIRLTLIKLVRPATQHSPAVYQWG